MKLDVSSYIAELLYDNDCVVLPDFGGFVASYKPSSIEFGEGTVNPPSKSISFNKSLTLNDALLINHIVKKEGLSYEETKKKVEKFAKKCNRALAENETVVFPSVGKLFYDIEKNLKFEADTTNLLSDSYGLPSVKDQPDIPEKVEEDKPMTLNERLAAEQAEKKSPAPIEESKMPEPIVEKTIVPEQITEKSVVEQIVEEKSVTAQERIEEEVVVPLAATTATTTAAKVATQKYTGNASLPKEEGVGILKWFPMLATLLIIGILGLLGWGAFQKMNNPVIGEIEGDDTELTVEIEEMDDDEATSDEDGFAATTDEVDEEELNKEIEDAGKEEINEEEEDEEVDLEMTETELKEQIKRTEKTYKEDITTNKETSNSNKTAANVSPGDKGYTIVVGAFSSRENAETRQRALEADGLDTEIGSLGRLFRVGVNVVCEPSEIQGKLREIQKKYNSKAWILKK